MTNQTKDNMTHWALVVLFLLWGLLGIPMMCNAQQTYKRQGTSFVQVSTSSSSPSTKTNFTWTDSKGKVYPIFITKNGRCYVNKVSSKTGKEYKYYLSEAISREICKELGVTYKERN